MTAANPYLMFDGNADEAFAFYKSVFGGEFPVKVRYRDMGGGPPGASREVLDRIAHVALPIGPNNMLMASDAMPGDPHTVGNSFYIALHPESAGEAERIFAALAEGGRVEMPLQRTEWAEKHGQCVDRFGVQWMVSYAGDVQFQPPEG